jgi:hypothetical protein
MESIRRAVGKMTYRRRHEGLTALERIEVNECWEVIFGLLTALISIAILDNPVYENIFAGGMAEWLFLVL